MKNELDILREFSASLRALQIPYMLTGSMAMNFYAVPQMTRDLDFVIQVTAQESQRLAATLESDYIIPHELVKKATENRTQFNLIHRDSVIKVDCMVLKNTEFAKSEFSRRRALSRGDLETIIVSKEDLNLSKLAWAKPSHSEVQFRDVRNLLQTDCDRLYLESWAAKLGLRDLLEECRRG